MTYMFSMHMNHTISNSQMLAPDCTINNLNSNPLCAFQCDYWHTVRFWGAYVM